MAPDQARLHAIATDLFSLRSESMPTWIDDATVAYLDDRSGVPHLFVTEADEGEPRQLTSGAERIQTLTGGANGTIVVGTDAGGNERQQLQRIDANGAAFSLTNSPDQIFEPYLVSPRGDAVIYRTNDGASGEFSLWSQHLETGERTCLWQDAGQVRAHGINEQGDVLASLLTSNLDADLYLIKADGSRTPVLQDTDESWILDAAFAPAPSQVLVLTNAGSEFVHLLAVDLATGERTILRKEDGDIEAFKLSPDGGRIAWSTNDAGYSRIQLATFDEIDHPTPVDLAPGVIDRFAWSPDSSRLAFGWLAATTPSRIQVLDWAGAARQLQSEAESAEKLPGVAPETITFQTFDGREIPAFWFPAEQSATAPVVIEVHGGPEGQRRPGFLPILQFLVASGFNVLTTNVRGSTGYGKTYSHLDDVEKRLDSVKDLEYAHRWVLDRVPESRGRIAVMGQSYGGFMTLSAITEYPNLWAAAVDVVGIGNFVTFLERTGPWRRRHREAEYGSLERDRELLAEISPIRKVDAITAPLFVIHGRNDPRVPFYETEQMVASMTDRKQPVQSLVFDNEGHGLSKRKNRIEGYAAAATFLWSVLDPSN